MQNLDVLFWVRWALMLWVCAAPAVGAASHELGKHPPIAATAAFDVRGNLWLARVEESHLVVRRSIDGGKSFGAPVRVSQKPEDILADGDNRPKILPAPNGDIYVSYALGLEKPYTGYIRFSRSTDGGQSFSKPITVNDDYDVTSHRFDAMALDPRGTLHIAWLDRRDKRVAQRIKQTYDGDALYYATSNDRGATFSRNMKLADHTCECCRVAMALERRGTPVLFWRHVFPTNIRDHALLRVDGNNVLRRVNIDNWNIDACPHHGGDLSIDGLGRYHAVWFNGTPDHTGVFYGRSTDRGVHFTDVRQFGRVDRQASHPAVWSEGSVVYVAWNEFDGRQASVWAMGSANGGHSWGMPQQLASSSGAVDHPHLISNGRVTYVTWNTRLDGWRIFPLTTLATVAR